jgi:hypothetical protein
MKHRAARFDSPISRRNLLIGGTAGLACLAADRRPSFAGPPAADADGKPENQAAQPRKLRIAAINSIFRLRSHAYHIVGRMVHGLRKDGLFHQPNLEVVRMFNHQSPKDDLGPSFCRQHGIELVESPRQALGVQGRLDVDAVALIIEHGDYPINSFDQVEYPRYEMFQEVVKVFQKSGRGVPVFVDKQLSYDHRQAAEMVATSEDLDFGLMAGSSLPVTWRIPQLELPLETPIEEAVVTFGFDRGVPEIYLIHGLETLQCMLERRQGGETGIRFVQCLQGDAVWQAIDAGRISGALVEEAISRSPSQNVGPLRENVLNPLAILLEYRDGTRAAVLNLIEQVADFGFACRLSAPSPLVGEGRGEGTKTVSCLFYLPPPPGARFFDPLTWHIEQFFHTGEPPYPIERTLLTSTALDLALHSLEDGSKPISSEALHIAYAPPKSSGFFRGPLTERE